jgi:hypothetical protein
MRKVVGSAGDEELSQNREITLFGSCLQAPAHRGVGFAAARPTDQVVQGAPQKIRPVGAAMDVLLRLDGVEVAPPGVAITMPLRMQRFHRNVRPQQRCPVDDQALAIAVEKLIGGGAAQPRAHSPDVRLDDAPAERIVEGLKLEFGEEVGGVVGRRHETLVLAASPRAAVVAAAGTGRTWRAAGAG